MEENEISLYEGCWNEYDVSQFPRVWYDLKCQCVQLCEAKMFQMSDVHCTVFNLITSLSVKITTMSSKYTYNICVCYYICTANMYVCAIEIISELK